MTNTLLTLHDPAVARRYYAEGLWRKDTLYTLLCGHAARRPEAFAVRDSRRRLSWGELRGMVDAVAADLDEAGLKRGERVAVWLPNRIEAVAILLACSRQGYVCNPSLHRNYTAAESGELVARPRRPRAPPAVPGRPRHRLMPRHSRSLIRRGRCRPSTRAPTRSPISPSPR